MFKILKDLCAHISGKRAVMLLILSTPALCHAEFNDPTKPNYPLAITTDSAATDTDKLKLTAIWITTHKWATINGVTAKQGETILNGIKIIKITRNTVSLNHNGHLETLRLLKSPYKTK